MNFRKDITNEIKITDSLCRILTIRRDSFLSGLCFGIGIGMMIILAVVELSK